MAGKEIPIFATHSVRSASTSKANIIELSIEDVQKAPGWKGNRRFWKQYKLPILTNFVEELLNTYTKKNLSCIKIVFTVVN